MTGLELILAGHLLLTPVSSSASVGSTSLGAPSLGAGAVTCPDQASPQIAVHWRSEPVKYDMSQSYGQLGNRSINSKNPYGTHVAVDVGGLMSGKVTYKSGIEVSGIRYPSSQVTCLWINKVNVDIVIDPTIFIANENPKGSCKFVAILEHESKHVATDRQVVQDHLETIRATALAAVEKVGIVGPKAEAASDDFKHKMSAYVEAALKAAIDDLYADRVKRQQALDSKAEYDRVEAKCH
jgi:hypothetical protein